MQLELQCPDGQTLPAIAPTTIHNGEFGLPEEGLPERVLSVNPVEGAAETAMLHVLSKGVEVLVERKDFDGWHFVDYLCDMEGCLLSNTAAMRFTLVKPEVPTSDPEHPLVFRVLQQQQASFGSATGQDGHIGQLLDAADLLERGGIPEASNTMEGWPAPPSNVPHLRAAATPLLDSVGPSTASPQMHATVPRSHHYNPQQQILRQRQQQGQEAQRRIAGGVQEAAWREMGFATEIEARAVLGNDVFDGVPEGGPLRDLGVSSCSREINNTFGSPRSDVADAGGPSHDEPLPLHHLASPNFPQVDFNHRPGAEDFAASLPAPCGSQGATSERPKRVPPLPPLPAASSSKRQRTTPGIVDAVARALSQGEEEDVRRGREHRADDLTAQLQAATASLSQHDSPLLPPRQGVPVVTGGTFSTSATLQPASSTAPPEERQPQSEAPFALLWIRFNLPKPCNHGCFGVKLRQVVSGAIKIALVSNFLIDFPWLLSACPALSSVKQLLVVHGQNEEETRAEILQYSASWGAQVTVCKPPLPIPYGTHHSKAFVLVYELGLRVIVHSANLVFADCNNKTQGLWFQDFPFLPPAAAGCATPPPSDFQATLTTYLATLCMPKAASTELFSAIKRTDFSSARAALIPSAPGRHKGPTIARLGHMRLRNLLSSMAFPPHFQKAPVCCQASSVGSLSEAWLKREFLSTLSAGKVSDTAGPGTSSADELGPPHPTSPSKGLHFVWPTEQDVRASFEGWAAGESLPAHLKNISKDCLKPHLSKWDASHCNRQRASPHIKTYCRFRGTDVAWAVLGSHNLSKAAWGELQNGGTTLAIRSYELAVLLSPSLEAAYRKHAHHGFSVTAQQHACGTSVDTAGVEPMLRCPSRCVSPNGAVRADERDGGKGEDAEIVFEAALQRTEGTAVGSAGSGGAGKEGVITVPLPLPYALPPAPYATGDMAWAVDALHHGLDERGITANDAFSRTLRYGLLQDGVKGYLDENN